ncbi:hypothetical protein, partial [Pseudomonas aeruginosa]
SEDVAGSTNPPTWSARNAATKGQKRYVKDGFTRTSLSTLPGVDHEEYDIVGLLRHDLAALPPAPPAQTSSW